MVSEAALEDMVAEYPYFTAARLLLAQKHYDRYLNLHAPAIKKAQLYSNNPHYFYQFITGELEKKATPAVTSLIDSPFTATTFTPADPTPLEGLDIPAAATPQKEEAIADTAAAMPPADETTEVPAATVAGTGITPGVADEIESVVDEWAEEPAADAGATASQLDFEAVVDDWGKTVTPDAAATAPTAEQEDEWADEEDTGSVSEQVAAAYMHEPPVAESAPEPAENVQEPVAAGTPEHTEHAASQAAGQQPEAPAQPHASEAAAEEPLKIFPLEIPEEETTLTFQPLYTDDYFAYKKLKEPEQADDLNEKGAAEMRSFTDWLREMKQGFAQKANRDWYHEQLSRSYVDADPEVSETVEKMAMESITLNDDIVSETLAEVWARQRQYKTAIQIYQKLSLLNPGKSTYFAQKIQELRTLQLESENQ